MAKHPRPPDAAAIKPESASAAANTTPDLPEVLSITLTTLAKGALLHRVHEACYHADQFNPGTQGNARFSPLRGLSGAAIPTLYGGVSIDCALMETVFHDVPHSSRLKLLAKSTLIGPCHSTMEVTRSLKLVDLASVALRKLGVTRKQLIDTEKDQYPATRKWAEALYNQCPQAQGLSWISRQDDSARAVVLFGDRIDSGVLRLVDAPCCLVQDRGMYEHVMDLAARLGVLIVPGKA